MNGKSLEKELRAVIAQAVQAMPKASVTELTSWIRKHHRALTKEFHEQWINAGLGSLCRAEMRHQRPMKHGRPGLGHSQQDKLPFPEFQNIPYRISIEPSSKTHHGKQIFTMQATLDELKRRRALIQGQFTAELPQLNQLIALMEPYDKMEPGIKVAKALELHGLKRPARGRRA